MQYIYKSNKIVEVVFIFGFIHVNDTLLYLTGYSNAQFVCLEIIIHK